MTRKLSYESVVQLEEDERKVDRALLHRYILDLLDQPDIVITPKGIWLSLRHRHGDDAPSREHISRRLRNELSEYGLVHQPFAGEERGYYALTELGERFLHDSDAEPEEFIADANDA